MSETSSTVTIPCNVNLATVEALEFASLYDPSGERTIGVLTKPDTVQDCADQKVIQILQNKLKPLKLGYSVVRNRTQAELINGVPLDAAKLLEKDFFRRSPIFSRRDLNLTPHLFGVDNLSRKLSKILCQRIKVLLPDIQQEIKDKMKEEKIKWRELVGHDELKELTERDYQFRLSELVVDFCDQVSTGVKGLYLDSTAEKAKIYSRVHNRAFDKFKNAVHKTAPDFDSNEFRTDLLHKKRCDRGREIAGFLSWQFFSREAKCMVANCNFPAENLITQSKTIVSEAISCILSQPKYTAYPSFKSWCLSFSETLLDQCEQVVKLKVKSFLESELQPFTMSHEASSVFRNNKAFIETLQHCIGHKMLTARKGDSKEFTIKVDSMWYFVSTGIKQGLEKLDMDKIDAEEMAYRLKDYWNVAENRIVDVICSTVDHEILLKFEDSLRKRLQVEALEKDCNKMLQEDDDVFYARQEIRLTINKLNNAKEIVEKSAAFA
eukprot:snap_masked-scaffold_7-processed-gene-12.17-mRNA-1 protein AED:0.65 eAED:0.67 QI:0/0/0/1/1/1/2/0/492